MARSNQSIAEAAIIMPAREWEEYFYEWTWPEEEQSARTLSCEVLGVEPSADLKEIKRAYRSLARRFHPDTDPSDTALVDRFKVISEAYEILTTDRNERTRQLMTMRSQDKQKKHRPYPEWWLQQFKDQF